MGMFLSKYSMLKALGYGADKYVMDETQKILNKFKLFGLILHDPIKHTEFHQKFAQSFERLDYLTGSNFLFLGLTDPPHKWIEKNKRDYFGIWDLDKLLNPLNAYTTDDEGITAFTIAKSIGIEYDQLPVIILTNNLQFNQFRIIKTCSQHLEKQLTEIGYFCSQKGIFFNLEHDYEFNQLIATINLCGEASHIHSEETLAKVLSDFLSFIVAGNDHSRDKQAAENHAHTVIQKFLEKVSFQRDTVRIEQLRLALLGHLSNLSICNSTDSALKIDNRCEHESSIILKTFNKVFPFFEEINNEVSNSYHIKERALRNKSSNNELDYSILIISLCKIFEIEINLSVVHWIRNNLKIEMPDYFKRYKNVSFPYLLSPSHEYTFDTPKPIDFNKRGKCNIWIAPGLGESLLITKTLASRGEIPPEINNIGEFIMKWSTLKNFRNLATHTQSLNEKNFQTVYTTFTALNDTGKFTEMNNLKLKFKG